MQHVRNALINASLRDTMFAYYNERAPEYEEAYTVGTGTSSIAPPDVLTSEAAALSDVVGTFGRGHAVDIACGTGYWLPRDAEHCQRVTLVDQAANMLAECANKAEALGIADRCELIEADVLRYNCPPARWIRSRYGETRRRFVEGGTSLRSSYGWQASDPLTPRPIPGGC